MRKAKHEKAPFISNGAFPLVFHLWKSNLKIIVGQVHILLGKSLLLGKAPQPRILGYHCILGCHFYLQPLFIGLNRPKGGFGLLNWILGMHLCLPVRMALGKGFVGL
jgi:hypothetical protein